MPAQPGKRRDAFAEAVLDCVAAIPAGRVGAPADIAHAYLYRLTQPFATGSILTVDGGTALA
jgi:NAD(P)-dependent dehydrogenase (short-subunit alcohol dehydrogenase family)